MKLEEIISIEELQEIFEEQSIAARNGKMEASAHVYFLGDFVPDGYATVFKRYTEDETGAAMYRMLAYIAYNLRKKELSQKP